MASGTLVRKVVMQIAADDMDAEAKLDAISRKADELKAKNPELAVRIETAAASAKVAVLREELKEVSKPVDIPVNPEIGFKALDDTFGWMRAIAAEKIEPEVKPKVEDDPAKTRIAELQLKLDRLRLEKIGVKVDVDAGPAEMKIAGLEAQIKALGYASGKSFAGGFGAQGYLITAGVVAALAALPAVAAAGGAAAGIALGAALLIGTKQVQGPLYKQFHSMTDGIMSVLRTAALPLVKPLGDAFAQIGRWARAMYPVLHSVFASLGPMVAPLTRGLTGLVSGVLPGFLRLMQAARPAVQAVAGVLSQLGSSAGAALGRLGPGVRSASQFLTGLGSAVSSLLPVVIQLANDVGSVLGPVMQTVGGKDVPLMSGALLGALRAVQPLLPELGQLVAVILDIETRAVMPLMPSLIGLTGAFSTLAARVLPSLIGPLEQVAGWLGTVANAASRAMSLLSHIPGLGFLGGGGSASFSMPSFTVAAPAVSGASSYSAAVSSATAAGYGNWASGITDLASSSGSSGSAAVAAAAKKKSGEMAQLGQQLTGSFAASLAGTKSAAAVKSGVDKLLGDVKTAWQDGVISLSRDESLTRWLDGQSVQLQALAARQGKVESEIATARKFAASTASSVYSNYDLASVAGSGTSTLGIPALKGALSADLTQIRRFSANIAKLQKMGLNKGYLGQLISMGPVNGGELANELASSSIADIKSINSAEYAISKASGQLGKTAANEMYDSGKQAGKGFLSGLEAQESAINKVMQKLAKSMVTTIRRELGIHSPSTVGHDIGSNFGTSVGAGVEAQVERAAQSSRRLSQALAHGAAAAHPAAGGGTAAAQQPGFTIRIVGGDKEFRTWLKKSIRVTGGNVTVVGA